MDECSIDSCTKAPYVRTVCRPHYNAAIREGWRDELPSLRPRNQTWAEYFAARVGAPDENGCVIWTGERNSLGYGKARLAGEKREAHRLALDLEGFDLTGMEVDHECRVPSCVNKDHLRPATRKQNMENAFGPLGSTSKERGVHFVAGRGKYRARVYHNKEIVFDKYFDLEQEAAEAARAARNKYFTYNSLDRV